MVTINFVLRIPGGLLDGPSAKAFVLYRDHIRPAIEARRADIEAMYASLWCGVGFLTLA